MRTRRGFSLVEMLVVLAVVAVLVSILLAGLGKARQAGRTALCLTNQHALGQGVSQYAADWRGVLPGQAYTEAYFNARNTFDAAWAKGSRYGTMALWQVQGHDHPGDYHFHNPDGALSGKRVGYSGVGFVWPYLVGHAVDSQCRLEPEGKTFYCPGTVLSFAGSELTGGPLLPQPKDNLYAQTFRGESAHCGFGLAGKVAWSTYYWRGGLFERDPHLDLDDSRWWTKTNWDIVSLKRLHDFIVAGKPWLTCWGGRVGAGKEISGGWRQQLPHGGDTTNLLRSDGSAATWRMPDGLLPAQGGYDGNCFHASESGPDDFASSDVQFRQRPDASATDHSQFPFWWALAARQPDLWP